jgi:hypothetical protein
MFFLVRSTFWLTMAFVTFHPQAIDLGATASAISGRAIAAGQQVIVNQILDQNCSLLGCAKSGKTAAIRDTASLDAPAITPPMQGSSISRPAPYPRPRPDWMG